MKETFTNNLEIAMDWIYKQGGFLTVGNMGNANTMTISWGSIGYMWRKPMFIVLVREERYTNEFLKDGDTYTVSIPYGDTLKDALKICGSTSGRNTNKEKRANIKFINGKEINTPVIYGCNKYYECKIILKQPIDLDKLNEKDKEIFYKDGNTKHILYFGEIISEYENN